MLTTKGSITIFLLFLFGALLFLGGLGVQVELVQYFGVFVGVVFVLSTLFLKRKLKLPPGFFLYSVFLLLFAINSFWSLDSAKTIEAFSLFLAGGLFWLSFYNLDLKRTSASFEAVLLGLGIVFGVLFFYYRFFVGAEVKWRSLFLPYSSHMNHNNIGDFWVVVLMLVSFRLLKDAKKLIYWLFLALGVYFLVVSQSRSALVAILVGFLYLTKDRLEKGKYKFYIPVIAVALGLFLFMGSGKTTLFTRPYYFQAVGGFIKNPFGVGMGNFHEISKDPTYHILGSGYSSIVHNILLEILVGLGILGLTFVYWFFERVSEIWRFGKNDNLLYGSIFLALAVNFFFHSTYFIPTTLWIWFFALGLFQKKASSA